MGLDSTLFKVLVLLDPLTLASIMLVSFQVKLHRPWILVHEA